MLIKKNDLQYLVKDDYYHSFLNEQDSIVKVFTYSEVKDIFFGTVDPKAYIYLMNKYDISYSLASVYVDNALNLKTDSSSNKVINDLINIKNELISNNFIYPSFRKPLLNKGFILKGFSFDFKEVKKILDDNNISYKEEYIDKQKESHNVYFYSSKILEVVDTLNYVAEALSNDVDMDDILIIAPDSYHYLIKNIALLFDIPIKDEDTRLDKTLLSFNIYNDLKEGKEIDLSLLEEQEDDSYSLKEIKENIKSILNEIDELDKNKDLSSKIVSDYYLFKSSKIKLSSANGIKISSRLSNPLDKYVYILGFIDSIVPTFKDDDYLSDKLKNDYSYLLSSYEKNEIEKERFRSYIDESKEVRISFASDSSDEVNRAFIEDTSLVSIEDFELKKDRYSLKADEFLYASYELNERLFGYKNELLNYLKSLNFNNVNTYINDSNFKNDDKYKIKLNKISYSGIKAYFECPFKYFCSRVLYINSDINNELPLLFGNLVHDKLEKYILNNEEHIERPSIDEDNNLSYSEQYFLNKRIDRFMSIAPDLESTLSGFEKFKKSPELELTYDLDDEHLIYVKYDLFLKDDKHFYIVDYKTGNDSFTYDLAMNGFNMQLPIYLYVAGQTYKDERPLGAMLHLIGNDKLVLDGLTSDASNLHLYLGENEERLKGFKRKQPYSISDTQYKELMESVDKQIHDAIKGIEDGEFSISPKVVYIGDNEKAHACTYCEFKDCCGLKNSQINRVFIKKEEEE